jgi:hypothetical protein
MVSVASSRCSSYAAYQSGRMGFASGPAGKSGQGAGSAGLTEEEQAQVEKLKARDREVRVHEAAHQAAAGGLATGGATFTYQRGPDGVSYAIGGEVNVDTSPVSGDPEATLRKAETIRRAALAPAEPSGQDRQVAAKAAQMAAEARAELAAQFKTVEAGGTDRPASIDIRV